MNRIKFFGLICFYLLAFSENSYSCSCIGNNFVDKSASGLRKYYQNNFEGAVFTGKVLSVEIYEIGEITNSNATEIDDEVKISKPSENSLAGKKIIVEIDKYWFGINNRKVIVYTGMNSGDCGISVKKGKKYLFIARYDENQLWTNICDYSFYKTFNKEQLTKKFVEILGTPSVFTKKFGL